MAQRRAIQRAKAAVRKLLAFWGTRDVEQLCKNLGIALYPRSNFHQLKGMYAVVEGRPCIFYKDSLSEEEKKLILAHELGHDQLHRELAEKQILIRDHMFLDMSSRPELEANLFAAELLISDESFLDYAQQGYSLEQLAAALAFPMDLLRLKAEILKEKGEPLQLSEPLSAHFSFGGGKDKI